MIKEAIILAGGFGTRLKELVPDTPKSMALIEDKPFLTYILDHLIKFRVEKAVIAAGYKHEDIIAFLGNSYKGISIEYSIENIPLRTGGAILKATKTISSRYCFVLNGDTFFNVDLSSFEESFNKNLTVLSVALKPMAGFDRYGSVTIEGERIISFNEKRYCENGLINGGVYIIDKQWINSNAPGEMFSFEKDLMEKCVSKDFISYFLSDTYFIDIGVPEDYIRAVKELPEQIV
jgi:D-glycero-alpha-D-manno-heptose 1-phosphate guanylyltransferase